MKIWRCNVDASWSDWFFVKGMCCWQSARSSKNLRKLSRAARRNVENCKNCRRKIARQFGDYLHKSLDTATGSSHHYDIAGGHQRSCLPSYHLRYSMLPWRALSIPRPRQQHVRIFAMRLVSWNQSSFKKMQPMAAAEVALKSPLIPLFSKGELLNCVFTPFLKKGGRGDFDPTLRKSLIPGH